MADQPSVGKPMRFVCQVALVPDLFGVIPTQLAYVFFTHPEVDDLDFFDPDIYFPDDGENAIILQPFEHGPRYVVWVHFYGRNSG